MSHGTNRWDEQEYTIVSVVQVNGQTGVHNNICCTHPTSVLVSHGTNRWDGQEHTGECSTVWMDIQDSHGTCGDVTTTP